MADPDRLLPDEAPPSPPELLADAQHRRERLVGNVEQLGDRLHPANLLSEGVDAARLAVSREWNRLSNEWLDLGADMIDDSLEFLSANRNWLIGGAVLTLAAAAGVRYASRKRPVPLYAAYDMEDPLMNDEPNDAASKAARAWDKVRDSADELGSKAGETYYSMRSRAADVTATAREQALHAAEVARERAAHAADVAREKAHEAAEAAREAAERAREAAGDARDWAVRQPKENPLTVVIAALAAGALLGALLPGGDDRDA